MNFLFTVLLTLTIGISLGTAASAELPLKSAYVGSAICGRCHIAMHEGWKQTYHSTVVRDTRTEPEAVLGDFSKGTAGLDRADIEYTVGGHWIQRYLRRIDGDLYALPSRWSVSSHKWEPVDVWSWRKKPYSRYCAGCHATRYDPNDQSLIEHTVGCEACHGPGRPHAEGLGQAAIVNPARLTQDEQDLICAACHVRGTDVSGIYQFPVGYVPGGNLEDHFVPARMSDGEDRREVLLREYRSWRGRVDRGEPSPCEVCGTKQPEEGAVVTEEENRNCRDCHKFEDDYSSHMGHPKKLTMECLDCHPPIGSTTVAPRTVHDPDYFLVHQGVRYAVAPIEACRTCHADLGEEELRARLRRWVQHHTAVRG